MMICGLYMYIFMDGIWREREGPRGCLLQDG